MPLLFLSLNTIDVWGRITRCESCPVRCSLFADVPGLYPLDASGKLSLFSQMQQPKMPSGFAKLCPRGWRWEESSLVENHWYSFGRLAIFVLFFHYVPWCSVLIFLVLKLFELLDLQVYTSNMKKISAIISSNTSLPFLPLLWKLQLHIYFPQINPIMFALLLSSFYRWGNWAIQRATYKDLAWCSTVNTWCWVWTQAPGLLLLGFTAVATFSAMISHQKDLKQKMLWHV